MVKYKPFKGSKIFLVAVLIILLDQASKYFIKKMPLHSSIAVINNLLYITYIQNTGAGFGLFRGTNLILIFVSLIIIGIILFYFDRIVKDPKTHLPAALILGGAVGNLIDRIFLGHVVDFIDFRIWPAFNIADSSITIAVLWLCIYFWKKPAR
jgi:signal peptidase II